MSQTITVNVKEKIATTDFSDVVTLNDVYRLSFTFDEEWEEYGRRVAAVFWEGGGAEREFGGTECEMPRIASSSAAEAWVGVYAVKDGKRISSSLVRLPCRAGAGNAPTAEPVEGLHEQILTALNERDWTVFDEKLEGGDFSAVSVDRRGFVRKGGTSVERGEEGQETPKETLFDGGVFYKREGGTDVPYLWKGKKLIPLGLRAEKVAHALTCGEKTFDGSASAELTAADLSLAEVATSGNYADLSGTPELAAVATSGLYTDLERTPALKPVATSGKYEDLSGKPELAAVATSGLYTDLERTPALKPVATSGKYEDLSGKPEFAKVATSGLYTDLERTPALKPVATSGSYNDLIDKPAIPDADDFVRKTGDTMSGQLTVRDTLSDGHRSFEGVLGPNSLTFYYRDSQFNDSLRSKFDIDTTGIINSNYATGEIHILNFPKKDGTFALTSDIADVGSLQYPIGSYYFTFTNASPNLFFGGSWEELASGTFLMAAGTGATSLMAETGSNSRTLTLAQMPKHNHPFPKDGTVLFAKVNNSSGAYGYLINGDGEERGVRPLYTTTEDRGSGEAVDITPKHVTVHIWRRIG